MHRQDDLVSVVIPAYNAQETLAETVESVRNQTHKNLEILIIDDGSKDNTREVAEQQAALDSRIQVITQTNGGVAKARNHGIEIAAGEIIAPVDADDLWRPRNVERQLRALRVGGEETGLAYCWSAVIDETSRVTSKGGRPHFQGDALLQLFHGNFIGNGSSAIMRKRFVLEAGGYDPGLKASNAQGCEDWKLYLLLAERCHFAVVLDHLVGYRFTASAMSGDVSQMLRSHALVRAEMAERHPNARHELDWSIRYYLEWLLWREASQRNWKNCRTIMHEMGFEGRPLRFGKRYWKTFASIARNRVRDRSKPVTGAPFLVAQDVPRASSGRDMSGRTLEAHSARVAAGVDALDPAERSALR